MLTPVNVKEPIFILSIEDNRADRFLIERFFDKLQPHFQIYFTEDGAEALDFVNRKGKYSTVPCPNFILLDLNLPKMDGREVLQKLKKDEHLKHIPVSILTSSRASEDVKSCMDLGAEKFFTKPPTLKELNSVFSEIERWMKQRN